MMDKLKYTAKEWDVHLIPEGLMVASEDVTICQMEDYENNEVDAQLIRAAPGMYEAILEILVILGDKPYRLNERWLENKLQSIIDKIHKKE